MSELILNNKLENWYFHLFHKMKGTEWESNPLKLGKNIDRKINTYVNEIKYFLWITEFLKYILRWNNTITLQIIKSYYYYQHRIKLFATMGERF